MKDDPNKLSFGDKLVLVIGKWLKQARCEHRKIYKLANETPYCYYCDKRLKCSE